MILILLLLSYKNVDNRHDLSLYWNVRKLVGRSERFFSILIIFLEHHVFYVHCVHSMPIMVDS